MARSPSNKGITNRNANVPPAGRNYTANTQAVRRIPGVEYGEQKELTEQQQAAPPSPCYLSLVYLKEAARIMHIQYISEV